MAENAEVSPTPEAVAAANPASGQEPVSASTGTTETPVSQAQETKGAGTEPDGETFFNGDPKSLPPELQQAYNNMLKDYKRKTGEVAEVRKKAEAYDQLAQNKQFQEYWSELSRSEKANFREQKAEVEKSLGEKISDAEFLKSFDTKETFLSLLEKVIEEKRVTDKKEIETLQKKVAFSEAADIVETVATEIGKDGKPTRPDFYALDEDQLISGYLRVNAPESPDQYQAKIVEAYNWAKAVSQKYYEKGKAEALAIVKQKATNSTEMPTNAAKNTYSGPNPLELSPADAVALARKGIRVPRND